MALTPAISAALRFDPAVPSAVRPRIEYAWRSFGAATGIEARIDPASAHVVVGYGTDDADLRLPASYSARPPHEPVPAPRWVRLAGEERDVPAFHGDGEIDPLGEIFEWLAAPHERSVTARDDVGRIPFASTIHGSHGIDPTVPWASLIMRWLERTILERAPGVGVRSRGTPRVVPSHDVDFVAGSWTQTMGRWARNVGIALLGHRDPRLAAAIVASPLRARRSPLDNIDLLLAGERDGAFASTFTLLARRAHARDANYDHADPRAASLVQRLRAAGCQVDVHGSYTSLEQPGRLAEEYANLRSLGADAIGGRQHWLRYADGRLYEALEEAGARYDSSAGFSDRVGFRHGHAGWFVPYDLREERPHRVVELPMVAMDVALEGMRVAGLDWAGDLRRVTTEIEGAGFDGASVLWHDAVFGGAWISAPIANAYWTLPTSRQRWVLAAEVVDDAWTAARGSGLVS